MADERTWESDELGITITVDYDLCKGHGKCLEECPSDPVVYELQDGKAVAVAIDECIECCACVDACPEGAVSHSSC